MAQKFLCGLFCFESRAIWSLEGLFGRVKGKTRWAASALNQGYKSGAVWSTRGFGLFVVIWQKGLSCDM